VAFAQSFALWQQATIEFTCHDHSPQMLVVTFNRSQVNIGKASMPRSLFLLVRSTYMYGVVLHTHPVRGESHNQCNTTGEVATLSLVVMTKHFWQFKSCRRKWSCCIFACDVMKLKVNQTKRFWYAWMNLNLDMVIQENF